MSLTVSIITPERVVSEKAADFVVLPAASGEMGILPGHVPLLAQLAMGEIRITLGSEVERLAVTGGFAEVRKDAVSIFAEAAERANEIDVERARQAAERARAYLRSSEADVDMERAEAALRRAILRLQIADFSRRKQSQK